MLDIAFDDPLFWTKYIQAWRKQVRMSIGLLCANSAMIGFWLMTKEPFMAILNLVLMTFIVCHILPRSLDGMINCTRHATQKEGFTT